MERDRKLDSGSGASKIQWSGSGARVSRNVEPAESAAHNPLKASNLKPGSHVTPSVSMRVTRQIKLMLKTVTERMECNPRPFCQSRDFGIEFA